MKMDCFILYLCGSKIFMRVMSRVKLSRNRGIVMSVFFMVVVLCGDGGINDVY